MNNTERRSTAYRIQVYREAINDALKMTYDEWIDSQSKCTGPYMTRIEWISYLKECAIKEAEKLSTDLLEDAA